MQKRLSEEEKARYRRQLIVPEIGEQGQLRIKKSTVLIAGLGGLGSIAAYYLAAAQDGTKVNINLTARPNDITTVQVRFGFLGNKDQSAYFHRTVMRNLGIE